MPTFDGTPKDFLTFTFLSLFLYWIVRSAVRAELKR